MADETFTISDNLETRVLQRVLNSGLPLPRYLILQTVKANPGTISTDLHDLIQERYHCKLPASSLFRHVRSLVDERYLRFEYEDHRKCAGPAPRKYWVNERRGDK